jgi:hypothetical protein
VISDAHQWLKAAAAATIRTVFAQPDPASAREQWRKVADAFRARHPRLAALLDAEADVLAYLAFPRVFPWMESGGHSAHRFACQARTLVAR